MLYSLPFILFIFWYLNKKSTSDYFYQDKDKLNEDLELIKTLYVHFGYKPSTILSTVAAFKYFIDNPSEYNGTSVLNDRFMINGLEPQSVKHDHKWIICKSLKDLLISNKEYCEELRKVNVNWFYVWGFIYLSLNLVSIFKSIINRFRESKIRTK